MRLAFSVAIHLEPDILLIDEALVVAEIDRLRAASEIMKRYAERPPLR